MTQGQDPSQQPPRDEQAPIPPEGFGVPWDRPASAEGASGQVADNGDTVLVAGPLGSPATPPRPTPVVGSAPSPQHAAFAPADSDLRDGDTVLTDTPLTAPSDPSATPATDARPSAVAATESQDEATKVRADAEQSGETVLMTSPFRVAGARTAPEEVDSSAADARASLPLEAALDPSITHPPAGPAGVPAPSTASAHDADPTDHGESGDTVLMAAPLRDLPRADASAHLDRTAGVPTTQQPTPADAAAGTPATDTPRDDTDGGTVLAPPGAGLYRPGTAATPRTPQVTGPVGPGFAVTESPGKPARAAFSVGLSRVRRKDPSSSAAPQRAVSGEPSGPAGPRPPGGDSTSTGATPPDRRRWLTIAIPLLVLALIGGIDAWVIAHRSATAPQSVATSASPTPSPKATSSRSGTASATAAPPRVSQKKAADIRLPDTLGDTFTQRRATPAPPPPNVNRAMYTSKSDGSQELIADVYLNDVSSVTRRSVAMESGSIADHGTYRCGKLAQGQVQACFGDVAGGMMEARASSAKTSREDVEKAFQAWVAATR